MKKIFFAITLIAFASSLSFAGSPPGNPPDHTTVQKEKFLQVQQVYLSQIGQIEVPEGSNWGPAVKMYLASVHVYSPSPWCAAFVHYCNHSAGVSDQITAWSPTAENKLNLVYSHGHYLQEPRAADVFTIYFPGLKRIAHTGFFDSKLNSHIIRTAEGNTNKAGSREGTVVMIKYRPIKTIYSISRWT